MVAKILIFNAFILITLNLTLSAVSSASKWRALDPEKTVLMTLPQGNVVIELAPQFSPDHVEQFRRLVKSGHYNGNKFYRVIDGFVAQAGPADQSLKDKLVPTLAIEGEWLTDKSWQYTPVQNNDLFAEQTGFKHGFALGHNPSENKAWLLHCPGVIAMARSNEPNSASSHFYITNGQAPRYLDRIMTIFGRVVYGMNHVQTITRTSVIEGERPVPVDTYTSILSIQMMNDVDKKDKILLEIEQTEHPSYRQKLVERRTRKNAFFYKKPPPVLDICQTPVLTRIAKKTTQHATD